MLMPGRSIMRIALFTSLLILQACATSPEQTAADTVSMASVQPASELDSLKEGDAVVFRTGILAPLGRVTIGREYHSASGRVCKRILHATSNELAAITCKAGEGQWYMRQRS